MGHIAHLKETVQINKHISANLWWYNNVDSERETLTKKNYSKL